jgi:hypothetical protein
MDKILIAPLHSFLTSPIVELIVGTGDKKTAMTAHQSLLLESPLLAEQVKAFGDGPVSNCSPYLNEARAHHCDWIAPD